MNSIGLRPVPAGRPARTPTAAPDAVRALSRRELQVLRLLNEGLLVKEVADRMKITVKTADNHCTHIRDKLGIHGPLSLHDFARSFRCACLLTEKKK